MVSTELVLGVIVVGAIIVIGLAFYGAKKWEEN